MDRVGFAISLNNEGVSELLAGKTIKAMDLFRSSLDEMKDLLRTPQHEVRSTTTARTTPPTCTASARQHIRLVQAAAAQQPSCSSNPSRTVVSRTTPRGGGGTTPPTTCSSSNSTAVPSKQMVSLHSTLSSVEDLKSVEEGFICSNPLLLNQMTPQELSSCQREHVVNIYSSCVVFNLALTYHCSSKLAGKSRRHDLKRAGQMYALVLNLLRRREYNQKVGTVNLLLLASMNNLSHILFFDLGEHQRALEGFKKVAVLLSGSRVDYPCTSNKNKSNNNSGRAAPHGLQAKDKSGLMWNICMLKPPTFAAAA